MATAVSDPIIRYIVVMERSYFQVNAFTSHGLFDDPEQATEFATTVLGWKLGTFTVHGITIHEGTI